MEAFVTVGEAALALGDNAKLAESRSAFVARGMAANGARCDFRSRARPSCYPMHQLERVRSARVRLPNAFVNNGGRCISYGRRNR